MKAQVIAAALAMLAAGPALADVKAGVEAWSRGDFATAVEQWRGPAIAGDPDAQFNMGQAYKLGRGVPLDLAQAESWYAKAAAHGHPMASDAYGLTLYTEGKRAEALPWLEKSAARDERRAELILGTMVFNGDGVPKDEVRGYALISRSSQQGLAQGSTTLAQMDGYMTPEQRERGLAMASEIAARAKAAQAAGPAVTTGKLARGTAVDGAVDAPAPAPMSHGHDRGPPPPARPAPSKTFVASVPAARPTPAPRVPTASKPTAAPVASGGHWRVQLGAFRESGAAQALWAKVGARVGGQPSYARAGAVTRLQAGPFASKVDAERACHAAGVSCVVVPG